MEKGAPVAEDKHFMNRLAYELFEKPLFFTNIENIFEYLKEKLQEQ